MKRLNSAFQGKLTLKLIKDGLEVHTDIVGNSRFKDFCKKNEYDIEYLGGNRYLVKNAIAPYLRIEGKKVNIGQKYYQIRLCMKGVYRIEKHFAGTQANTVQTLYFLDRSDAQRAAEIYMLHNTLDRQITEIEKKYLPDLF